MAIRYDKKFVKEINKVVRNFNLKVNRVKSKGRSAPQVIKSKDLKNILKLMRSRKEVRDKLKDLQAYTKRGAEAIVNFYGKNVEKWQVENYRRHRRNIRRKINEDLEFYQTTKPEIYGDVTDFTFEEMRSREYTNLIRKKKRLLEADLKSMNEEELFNYFNLMEKNDKRSRDKIFRDNYITMLKDNARLFGIYSKKVDEIIKKIKRLTPKEFYRFYKKEQGLSNVVLRYSVILDSMDINELVEMQEDINDEYTKIYELLANKNM